MAQVYSVNAVGYVNLDLPQGFSLIANPLNNGSNKIGDVIPTAPNGSTIFKFDGVGFDNNAPSYLEGFGWFQAPPGDAATYTLNPGQGVFISLPAAAKLTFVGEVPQGTLTTTVPTGFSILASQVPQAGTLTTALGFTGALQDTVFKFLRATQKYDDNTPQYFGPEVGWFPSEPTLEVGESFFLLRTAAAGTWTRTFSVNN